MFPAILWACTCIANAANIEASPSSDHSDRETLPSASKQFIIAQANILFGEQQPTTIAIDIIPDSPNNIVQPGAWRVLPVAILGSAELEVTSINPRTIRLNGVDIMLVGKSDKSLCVEKDINDDTYKDLLCDVRSTGFKIVEGEYAIIIKAGTYSGESLRGEDRIRIVSK